MISGITNLVFVDNGDQPYFVNVSEYVSQKR